MRVRSKADRLEKARRRKEMVVTYRDRNKYGLPKSKFVKRNRLHEIRRDPRVWFATDSFTGRVLYGQGPISVTVKEEYADEYCFWMFDTADIAWLVDEGIAEHIYDSGSGLLLYSTEYPHTELTPMFKKLYKDAKYGRRR